jgi:hypothetical protein
MLDEELLTLLGELPLRRDDHRLQLRADRLADQPMHPPTQLIDVLADLPRGIHNRRRVEDTAVARHIVAPEVPAIGVRIGRLDPVPVGVAAGQERLAHSGGPVAQPDVAIATTGVAELAEPAIFPRLDEGRARRISHRRTA